MKQTFTLHPARAAIAAVLALGSTPLMAQTIDPVAPPPVIATQAPSSSVPDVTVSAPAAAAPVFVAPTPVVQSISAPLAVADETASIPVKAAHTRKVAITRAAPILRTVALPEKAKSPPVTARVIKTPPVVPVPVISSSVEGATIPIVTTPENKDGLLQWSLIGGALLLVGGAGAASLIRRRRPAQSNGVYASTPLMDAAPIVPTSLTAPVIADRTASSIQPMGSIQEMVASAPSAENPFLTRKNRLRRANFLMQGGQHVALQPAAPAITVKTPVQPAREAPIYDFGRGMRGERRGGFFPARA